MANPSGPGCYWCGKQPGYDGRGHEPRCPGVKDHESHRPATGDAECLSPTVEKVGMGSRAAFPCRVATKVRKRWCFNCLAHGA